MVGGSHRILKVHVFRLESGVHFISLVAGLLQVCAVVDYAKFSP
jgi:hypothetical protein